MEFIEVLKIIHVASGIIVGLTGLANILLKKGGKLHRTLGMTYFVTWFFIIGTGGILGHPVITLFGVLGFYMAYTGARLGRLKSTKFALIDKVVVCFCLFLALLTLGSGVWLLIGRFIPMGIVATVLGAVFSHLAIQDFRAFVVGQQFRKLSGHPLEWYFEHLTRMSISYIAAMTAFTAIQEVFPIAILNWLAPGAIGTVLITITNRRYRRKMKVPPFDK